MTDATDRPATGIEREMVVPGRFCGPPTSGNGGWVAGELAGHLGGPAGDGAAVTVTLQAPPPLDTALSVREDGEGVSATLDGAPVATARPAADDPTAPAAVSPGVAARAETAYAGLGSHPFPTCFVCGTGREPGDGLRIFPGRVEDDAGRPRVAATWTPHASLAADFHSYGDRIPRASLAVAWAALDCVGGWAGDLGERLMVLGRMTARIRALPVLGEPHVVVGVGLGGEGRRTFTASALHDSDGRLVGSAEHVWVAVDPARFGG